MLFCTAVQPFRLHLPSLILHCQYKYFFLVFINFKNSNIIVNDQLFIFFSGIAAYQTVLVRFWKQFQLFYCLPNPIRLFFCSFRWQFFKCNILFTPVSSCKPQATWDFAAIQRTFPLPQPRVFRQLYASQRAPRCPAPVYRHLSSLAAVWKLCRCQADFPPSAALCLAGRYIPPSCRRP